MKIIRPEQPMKRAEEKPKEKEKEKEKEENLSLIIDGHEVTPFTENAESQSIENIMNEVLKENTRDITFTVTITKRQYEIWTKKGGEKWLKKALDGQTKSKSKSKKKKVR